MKKLALLGIDLQNDFTSPSGALSVTGADKDVQRIVQFIQKHSHRLDYVALTLDSHQPIHIANQCYWKDAEGNPPDLFSTILFQDVATGKWMPQYNKLRALNYLKALAEKGEQCTIWPPHCIQGTEGWAIDKKLTDALYNWSITENKQYELFYKGTHQATEHYSIFKAAIAYKDAPETQLNTYLLNLLNTYEQVVLVGEAADFCVASSLNDILDYAPELVSKLCVLTDCMSWIVPNNPKAEAIFDKAKAKGVMFLQSVDFIV